MHVLHVISNNKLYDSYGMNKINIKIRNNILIIFEENWIRVQYLLNYMNNTQIFVLNMFYKRKK